MKKLLILLLTVAMLLSVAGCGGNTSDTSDADVSATTVATTTKSTAATKTTADDTTTTADTTTTTGKDNTQATTAITAATAGTTAGTTAATTAAPTTTTTTKKATTTQGAWKMKNILIFGDSYSTFEGQIPNGYVTWYPQTNEPNDVTKVEETWWKQLATDYSLNIVRNDSWSGSTIANLGYGGADVSRTSSFIWRLEMLDANDYFAENPVDTVFVFGGTNDSWAGTAVGEPKYAQLTEADANEVLPACCYFIKRLKEVLPNAKIVWIINNGLKDEIMDGMETIATKYRIACVRLSGIDKQSGHPSVKGMGQIEEQIVAVLDKKYPTWRG